MRKNALLSTKGANKEHFTMRGHLDQLEKTLNEIVTEIEYHNTQLQITRSDKETAGAQLDIGAIAC
jgi:hypothetical protein